MKYRTTEQLENLIDILHGMKSEVKIKLENPNVIGYMQARILRKRHANLSKRITKLTNDLRAQKDQLSLGTMPPKTDI